MERRQSAEDVIRAAQTVPVLFLDEFHLSKYTPDRLEKMEEILDWRHNRNLPYFIAANFKDLKELEALEKWGGWFGSRVRKICTGIGWVVWPCVKVVSFMAKRT